MILHFGGTFNGSVVDRLETDEQAFAAAVAHLVQQLELIADIGGDSGVPAEMHRFHLTDQFSRPGDITDEIIVDKHDLSGAESVDFLDHIFDGPVQVTAQHV